MRENVKKRLEVLTGYLAGVGIIGFNVFIFELCNTNDRLYGETFRRVELIADHNIDGLDIEELSELYYEMGINHSRNYWPRPTIEQRSLGN